MANPHAPQTTARFVTRLLGFGFLGLGFGAAFGADAVVLAHRYIYGGPETPQPPGLLFPALVRLASAHSTRLERLIAIDPAAVVYPALFLTGVFVALWLACRRGRRAVMGTVGIVLAPVAFLMVGGSLGNLLLKVAVYCVPGFGLPEAEKEPRLAAWLAVGLALLGAFLLRRSARRSPTRPITMIIPVTLLWSSVVLWGIARPLFERALCDLPQQLILWGEANRIGLIWVLQDAAAYAAAGLAAAPVVLWVMRSSGGGQYWRPTAAWGATVGATFGFLHGLAWWNAGSIGATLFPDSLPVLRFIFAHFTILGVLGGLALAVGLSARGLSPAGRNAATAGIALIVVAASAAMGLSISSLGRARLQYVQAKREAKTARAGGSGLVRFSMGDGRVESRPVPAGKAAAAVWERFLNCYPRSPYRGLALFERARAGIDSSDPALTETAVVAAIAEHVYPGMLRRWHAESLARFGRYREAAAAWEELLARYSDGNAQPLRWHLAAAEAWQRVGEWGKAERHYGLAQPEALRSWRAYPHGISPDRLKEARRAVSRAEAEGLRTWTGAVTGRVQLDGKGLPGARVMLSGWAFSLDNRPAWETSYRPLAGAATSDAQGRFSITHLPPGRYDLTLLVPDAAFRGAPMTVSLPTLVEVKRGETRLHDIVFAPTGPR